MGSIGAARTLRRAVLALLMALPQGANAACQPDSLELRGPFGAARFNVELADTAAERAKGLMLRPEMAKSAGMLFVYDRPQHVAFWMKNTLIPLDMLFIDAQGRVVRLHANARVKDETPIDGGDDIAYVLEINGGLAARMGISEGAEVRHAAMDQASAVWPCSAP